MAPFELPPYPETSLTFSAVDGWELCSVIKTNALLSELQERRPATLAFRRKDVLRELEEAALSDDDDLLTFSEHEITMLGLKKLLRSYVPEQSWDNVEYKDLKKEFVRAKNRDSEEGTEKWLDLTDHFRFTELPKELQLQIVGYTVEEDKVVGLDDYGKSPYLHATSFKVPVLASVSRYLRSLTLKEFYRVNTFGYEIRGKDETALNDALMLHLTLFGLPAPFNDKNSVPHGQEGTDGAISVPSLYIRNLHVHLPARLRLGRRRTIMFDTAEATRQLERCVVKYSQVWRPQLKGHQLLHNLCQIILCTYSHRQEISQTAWDTKTLMTDLFLTERTRTIKTVGEMRGDLTGWEMPFQAVWS